MKAFIFALTLLVSVVSFADPEAAKPPAGAAGKRAIVRGTPSQAEGVQLCGCHLANPQSVPAKKGKVKFEGNERNIWEMYASCHQGVGCAEKCLGKPPKEGCAEVTKYTYCFSEGEAAPEASACMESRHQTKNVDLLKVAWQDTGAHASPSSSHGKESQKVEDASSKELTLKTIPAVPASPADNAAKAHKVSHAARAAVRGGAAQTPTKKPTIPTDESSVPGQK